MKTYPIVRKTNRAVAAICAPLLAMLLASCSGPSTAPAPSPAAKQAPGPDEPPQAATPKTGVALQPGASVPAAILTFQQHCAAKEFVCYNADLFPYQADYTKTEPAAYAALMKSERWWAAAEKVHQTANPPVFVVLTGYGATEAAAEAQVEGKM